MLDGLEQIKICVAYRYGDEELKVLPINPEVLAKCEPIYETMPGWTESTAQIKDYNQLPQAAKNYLDYIAKEVGAQVDIISTGPERDAAIILQDF